MIPDTSALLPLAVALVATELRDRAPGRPGGAKMARLVRQVKVSLRLPLADEGALKAAAAALADGVLARVGRRRFHYVTLPPLKSPPAIGCITHEQGPGREGSVVLGNGVAARTFAHLEESGPVLTMDVLIAVNARRVRAHVLRRAKHHHRQVAKAMFAMRGRGISEGMRRLNDMEKKLR